MAGFRKLADQLRRGMKSARQLLRKALRIAHFAALGIEAVVRLAAVWAAVRLLPPRKWRGWLKPAAQQPLPPPQLARDLRRLMRFLAPALPRRSRCLISAMAARAMLARRGYGSTLSLGADISQATLTAHAWLSAGSIIITGREAMQDYREVARF